MTRRNILSRWHHCAQKSLFSYIMPHLRHLVILHSNIVFIALGVNGRRVIIIWTSCWLIVHLIMSPSFKGCFLRKMIAWFVMVARGTATFDRMPQFNCRLKSATNSLPVSLTKWNRYDMHISNAKIFEAVNAVSFARIDKVHSLSRKVSHNPSCVWISAFITALQYYVLMMNSSCALIYCL
jgi:hypothetical protein